MKRVLRQGDLQIAKRSDHARGFEVPSTGSSSEPARGSIAVAGRPQPLGACLPSRRYPAHATKALQPHDDAKHQASARLGHLGGLSACLNNRKLAYSPHWK